MTIAEIIAGVIFWSLCGSIPCMIWASQKCTDGWELCNPYWVHYYHSSVNWFGAVILSLLYTAFCPICALIYWLYKLCTVGRK